MNILLMTLAIRVWIHAIMVVSEIQIAIYVLILYAKIASSSIVPVKTVRRIPLNFLKQFYVNAIITFIGIVHSENVKLVWATAVFVKIMKNV